MTIFNGLLSFLNVKFGFFESFSQEIETYFSIFVNFFGKIFNYADIDIDLV